MKFLSKVLAAGKDPATAWAEEIVKELKEDVKEFGYGGVYLAIMDMDGGFDVEIELSSGELGDSYMDAGETKAKARAAADKIEKVLTKHKIKVFKTRSAWEKHIEKIDGLT